MVSSTLNLSPSSPRENSKAHPPRSLPSDPPGSSATPSIDTNSDTTILPISCSFRLASANETGDGTETSRSGSGSAWQRAQGHVAEGTPGLVPRAAAGRLRGHEALAVSAPAAIDGAARSLPRSGRVNPAHDPADLRATAVGRAREELVAVGHATVKRGCARDALVQNEAEISLKAICGPDAAGGRQMVALAAVAGHGVDVAPQAGDRDREAQAALVRVTGAVALGVIGDTELIGLRYAAAVDGAGGNSGRLVHVDVADRAEDLRAATVGRERKELVAVCIAAVEGSRAGEWLVRQQAEVGLEAVGRSDDAGGREVIALPAVAVDPVDVAPQRGDRDREPQEPLVHVGGIVACRIVGDGELARVAGTAAVDGVGGKARRAGRVRVADPAADLRAAAVGGAREELVPGRAAAVEGDGAGELLDRQEAEVGLESVCRPDGAGGREVVALAAVTADRVDVVHQPAGDVTRIRATRVLSRSADPAAELELVRDPVAVTIRGAEHRAVEVVRVDVERVAAVPLVVTAAVLADALVVAPVAVREVRIVGGAPAVPVRDPDVVGLRVAGAVAAREVADPRAGAAVHAGEVAGRVKPGGPRLHEPKRRAAVRRAARVVLHVEVDRAPRAHPECPRVPDRVPSRGPPLLPRLAPVDRRAAAARTRRLKTDVDGHERPAGAGHLAHPARRQVRLAAPAVGAPDVDARGSIGRRKPRGHRQPRGSRAGVEPEPLAIRAAWNG